MGTCYLLRRRLFLRGALERRRKLEKNQEEDHNLHSTLLLFSETKPQSSWKRTRKKITICISPSSSSLKTSQSQSRWKRTRKITICISETGLTHNHNHRPEEKTRGIFNRRLCTFVFSRIVILCSLLCILLAHLCLCVFFLAHLCFVCVLLGSLVFIPNKPCCEGSSRSE